MRDEMAAGAVVWRRTEPGRGPEVVLVHRPKYDDWSFPKGTLEDGEHAVTAAVREVAEETGISVALGPPLPPAHYRKSDGTPKVVHYWQAMQADAEDPPFHPSREVDERRWLPAEEARDRLTHAHDRRLLDSLVPRPTVPLVLLRHAAAVSRAAWTDTDTARPLEDLGWDQAQRLDPILAAYGITRVVSSPAVRCLDTVRPYARRLGLQIELEPALAEEAPVSHTRDRAGALRADLVPAVWCSHRPMLPTLAEALGVPHVALDPGELRVLHRPVAPLALDEYAPTEQHTP